MPFPLGAVKPPNAGTPLQITNNFTDLVGEAVYSVTIQALVNTNPVYILAQSAATGKNTTSYVNIIAVLTSGQSLTLTSRYGNQIPIDKIWVDPTTNGEGVLSFIFKN